MQNHTSILTRYIPLVFVFLWSTGFIGGYINLVAASFIQYIATAVLMGALTFGFETQVIDWQWPLIGGLVWLVFGLSVSAILLLLFMIKHGESAKVASYFYLVPGLTAIEAWILFNETLPLLAVFGLMISILGVYLTINNKTNAIKSS